MPGVGDKLIPKFPLPRFSEDNPYWQDPAKWWGWLCPQARPRLTAQDFLYATTWEIYHLDWWMARMIREETVKAVRVATRQHDYRGLLNKEAGSNAKTAA
jgi:hypothetical protein